MRKCYDPQFDRAFKVRPLIDHFNRCFQAARKASMQQSIDEHMVKFKIIIKQYIRNKPVNGDLNCGADVMLSQVICTSLTCIPDAKQTRPRGRCGYHAHKVTGTALLSDFH